MNNIYITYNNKPILADVVIMRLGLIFLLIGTHTFAPYSGSWESLPNSNDLSIYKYFSSFAHYISMPALIFISGYLFGHTWQRTTAQPFKTFVFKKFKRLIIPSIIFSFFYFLLFKDTTLPTSKVSYAIVNGCGHLWFLPMLFWSFICCYLLHKSKIDNKIIIALLAILSILPIPTLPLRLSSTCTYLVFFYLGSIMQISGGGVNP